MDYTYVTIFLLTLGMIFIVAEVFLPTGGLIGICATGCILGSIWYAWMAWAEESPAIWWSYLGFLVVLIPSTIAGTFYLLPRTPFGKVIFNQGPTLEEVTPFEKEKKELNALIGLRGKTLTLHNPGGMVIVAGHRHHSESEGVIIDPNTQVEVIGVSGNRIQVRECPEGSVEESAENQVSDSDKNEPTDFDMNIS